MKPLAPKSIYSFYGPTTERGQTTKLTLLPYICMYILAMRGRHICFYPKMQTPHCPNTLYTNMKKTSVKVL